MTVPVADTKHVKATEDYAAIQAEAIALAESILFELKGEVLPETVNWGHVGTIAHYRTQLRDIHDSMFAQGEYAR